MVAAAMIAVAAPAMAQTTKNDDTPPMQVGTDAVISETLSQTVLVIGRLVARQTGVVAARINGPISEIRAKVGDRIKAGNIIAVLLNDTLKWSLELQTANEQQSQAAVITRKARIKLRIQEMQRIERLMESAAFSQARLDDKRQDVAVAESELVEASAQLASARANRKLAEINLYNATIRAPYSGVVTKRHSEVGAYVKVGDPLVTLVDDTNLEIEAEVPAARTVGLKPSTKIDVYINSTTRITATVRAIVPEENPQTRTRTVRFIPEFSSHQSDLAANQSVTLQLPVNSAKTAITVHKDAIISQKGITLVYLAKDSKAQLRPVRLGEAVGTRFIVNSGLTPGDLVVVRGNERLKPGQDIRYGDKNENAAPATGKDKAKG
ncbi:MAG: efflux RND transporter periplasmic adaptor subunit [Proteobacteria bacterium]|nr:efflux RND transporter periplasmic adaptor subunit [Pseudomonadota bacterium]